MLRHSLASMRTPLLRTWSAAPSCPSPSSRWREAEARADLGQLRRPLEDARVEAGRSSAMEAAIPPMPPPATSTRMRLAGEYFRRRREGPGMKAFEDRAHAGRELAARLGAFEGRDDVVVLGLARGGVPVAAAVGHELRVPFDAFAVRKLGVPWQEELAFGAVASGGVRVLNADVVRELPLPQRGDRRDRGARGARARAARARLPRRPPAGRPRGPDRDPRRRRDRDRLLHARGGAGRPLAARPRRCSIAVPVAPERDVRRARAGGRVAWCAC